MQQQSPGRTSYKDWCVVVLALVLPTFVTSCLLRVGRRISCGGSTGNLQHSQGHSVCPARRLGLLDPT